MRDEDLRRLVRQVAQRHVETAHPERLEELDAVFDVAYERALEGASLASDAYGGEGGGAGVGDGGLPFDTTLLEMGPALSAVVLAAQLVQIALLPRYVERRASERVSALVAKLEGLSRSQRQEAEKVAALVVRALEEREAAAPPEPVGVDALQLLVRRRDRDGRPVLEFFLHGTAGDSAYACHRFGETVLPREPQAYFDELFHHMVMREATDRETREADARWVRQRGANLFEVFLPDGLQAELRSLARIGGNLVVISEEPWIPWELLKLPAGSEDGEGSFLCEAFALARWLAGPPPPQRLPLRRLAVVRSRRSDLERAEEEAAFLLGLSDGEARRVDAVEAGYLALTRAMARGRHDGWHFIGHGDRSRAGPEWWAIALDDRTMTPQDLSDEVALGLRRSRPFVFLNACRVAGSAPGLVGLGGWPARFLEVGAGAFLGPLWAVRSDRAAEFARLVYRRLLAGEPVGEAVRRARLELRERHPGDPTWLAYALYADPGATCPPLGG